MYAIIAFFLTLVQLAIVISSYVMEAHGIFITAVIYGSPFYSLMTLLGSDSAFLDNNPLYMALFAYHVVKYFLFFKAQMSDQQGPIFTLAVLMEGLYLALSGYYLNY